MSTDPVGRLIELGRDNEAAQLAVRDAGGMTMGPLEQFEVLLPEFDRLLEGVGTEELEATTPCQGWAVRDLLTHMNGGARVFAGAFEQRPPREKDLGADAVGTVREALSEFHDAVRSPGALERAVDSPFGTMPGEQFARLAALDLLVHTWDLSKATGQRVAVPDHVVAAVDGFARQAITPELRGPQTFAPEVSTPEGGSALDRLAAFTGRRP